jgi:hypothetical protein
MNYSEYLKLRKEKIQILDRYNDLAIKFIGKSQKGSFLDSKEYQTEFQHYIQTGFLESESKCVTSLEDIVFTLENKSRLNVSKALNNFLFGIDKALPELNLELYFYIINLGYHDIYSYIKGDYFLSYLRPFPSDNPEELMHWADCNLKHPVERDIAISKRQMYREEVFLYSEFWPTRYFEIISEVNSIPAFRPGEIEILHFKNCIQIIRDNPNAEKSEIPKLLAKATKGMSINRAKLFLVYLGLLGVLLPKGRTPIFFPNSILECRDLPMNAGKFHCYPYYLWQPKDGVNEEYLEYWFKDYI